MRRTFIAPLLALLLLFSSADATASPVDRVGWIAGGHISPLTLYRSNELEKVMQSQVNAHFNTLFVTVKQFDGRIWYYSEEFPGLMALPAPGFRYTKEDNPLQKIIDAAHSVRPRQGVIALIQAFNDKHAAWNLFPEARIGNLDWVDPAYVPMQDYIIKIAVDLARNYNVDGISLDMVRYPTGATKLPFTKDRDRVEVITGFVERFAQAVKEVDPTIEVSANVFADAVKGPVQSIGQDITALAGTVDYLLPMLYPYDDNAGSSDDLLHYEYQLNSVKSALTQVDDPDLIKPDVQAFFGYDFDDITAQIRGVRDGGGTGVMVYAYDFDIKWNPGEWKAVAEAMPESWHRSRFRSDSKPPQFTNITAMGTTVAWTTDEPTTGRVRVWYQEVEQMLETRWGRHHVLNLPLNDGVIYPFEIIAIDGAGNEAVAAGELTSSEMPEQKAELLSFGVSDANDIWVRVKWQTTLPVMPIIEVRGNGNRIIDLRTFDTEHEFLLDGLEGGVEYRVRVLGVDGWGRKTLLTETEFSTPANLALGKEAIASSTVHKGFEADKAVDGNLQTRWCSKYSDLQYLIVDLGTPQTVRGFGIEWEYAYAKSYRIRVSTDGKAWEEVYSTDKGQGGREDISIKPVTARYVQLVATERGTGLGHSLWEFKVF